MSRLSASKSSLIRREPVEIRAPIVGNVVVVCIGAALLAASLTLPWLDGAILDATEVPRGWSAPVVALPVLAAAAAVVFGALVEGWVLRRRVLAIALCVGGVCAGVAGASILVVELTTGLVPRSLLPATARRLTLSLSADAGLWMAFAGSLVIVAGAGIRGRPLRAVSLVGTALLVVATVSFGWLRYTPWFEASVTGRELTLQGWATPWVGPLSLLTVLLLVAALAVTLTTAVRFGALLAGAAGWLGTVAAAVAVLAATSLAKVPVDPLLGDASPRFTAAAGAWGAFVAGLAAAAAAAIMLSALRPPEDEGWSRS